MKNKKTLLLIISALILSVTGCGDGMTPQEREEADRQTGAAELVGIPIDGAQEQPGEAGEQNPENVELEQQIRELERRYGTPDFSQVEYLTLAELYNENNQVKKQRDTLEICFALYQDSAAEEQLQQLTVNVSEEEPGVQGQMTLLEQNLSTQGYIDEAVSMLHGEEWRDTMMPRLNQGTRGYYQEQGDNSLYVRTGYDASGAFYTQAQYRQGEQVTVLLQTDVSVQLLETRMKEGQYDGVYECWTVLAASGDVIRENGNLKDGVLVGDYTAQIRWGKGENELLPLWNLREDMEMTTYNGSFGEDGISTAAQLSEAGDAIVYAYDSGKQNYLFFSGEETAAADSYVFRAESMSMPVLQTYAAYEPREDQTGTPASGTIDIAQLQVRVFGGNIQVFDGTGWIDMGAAEDYIAADPVTLSSQVAEDGNAAGAAGGTGNVGQGITAVYARRGSGRVTPIATPKPTSKPTTPATPAAPVTPVTPTVPVVVPTPAPTQAPAPVQPSNPQPSNPNPAPQPSNPEPAPQPTPAPTPAPTPQPTDPPITGGDSDVEWSPDLM